MPRFFIEQNQVAEDYVTIVGDDAHHISRSLRMAAGEKITVCIKEGNQYVCQLEEFGDGFVKARVLETLSLSTELPVRIHLFQALPKGEKFDFIIQKAVECGVYDITPFESERCVVKVKTDAEPRKTERRNKISLEAAKQCGRGLVPNVFSTISFNEMLEKASQSDLALFCYEGDDVKQMGKILMDARNYNREIKDISIVIGSEGGFSSNEASVAIKSGLLSTGLGKRILRAETAAIFALSCLVYEFELN